MLLLVAPVAWSGGSANLSSPDSGNVSKLPFKQQADTDATVLLRTLGGLIAVIILGYGGVYVLKRYFPSVTGYSATGQNRINVLETRRLTPKTTLFLVEVEGARLLLAQSGDRVSTLHTAIPQPQKTDSVERGSG